MVAWRAGESVERLVGCGEDEGSNRRMGVFASVCSDLNSQDQRHKSTSSTQNNQHVSYIFNTELNKSAKGCNWRKLQTHDDARSKCGRLLWQVKGHVGTDFLRTTTTQDTLYKTMTAVTRYQSPDRKGDKEDNDENLVLGTNPRQARHFQKRK
jgi:hypothetical protein